VPSFGHPAGLGWLSFCELWERFSYYGMQALLVLYLSNYLFLPANIGDVAGMDALRAAIENVTGPRSPMQLASAVFGLYVGLVYLTPIFGGLLADRVLGRTRTVVLGALLMATGHFLMAFEGAAAGAGLPAARRGLLQGQYRGPGGRPLCAGRQASRQRLPDLHAGGAGRRHRRAPRLRHAG
jgi:dipeptide/tripeptide permease